MSDDHLDNLKEGVDWQIVGTTTIEVNGKWVDWGIQVKQEGPYKDVVLIFGEMSIDTTKGEDKAELTFDYDVFHDADKDIDLQDSELKQLAGDLLIVAFTQALDEGKAVINGDSEQDYPTITLDQ